MQKYFSFPTFKYAAKDIPAGIVVFLVALPLCLGIALASGAPAMSGLIAGIIGGVVVSFFSGSELSVSGPAAGLAVIVLNAITSLGTFEIFLAAVVLAGIFQFILGVLKAGVIGEYVPNSVIRGMLAGIGVLISIKQIPHLIGWDAEAELDEAVFSFPQLLQGATALDPLLDAFKHVEIGPMIIGVSCLAFLVLWDLPFRKKIKSLKLVPGPLLVVVIGVVINLVFVMVDSTLALTGSQGHLVNVPVSSEGDTLFRLPDYAALTNVQVWFTAITITLVASVETLLSVEAVDKLDPQRRISETSRELRAQGIGNTISGMIGGLPITAVIVRSSTNVYAGGQTRLSAIIHGILLAICVLLIPDILNMIPKAALAAILISVGYKLTSVTVIRESWEHGLDQFIPFGVTIIAIVLTDLLTGIGIGFLVSIFFVLRSNHLSAVTVVNTGTTWLIRFNKDVTFVNKSDVKQALQELPAGCRVIIDASKSAFIDHDIFDTLGEFSEGAPYRDIEVEYINVFGKRRNKR